MQQADIFKKLFIAGALAMMAPMTYGQEAADSADVSESSSASSFSETSPGGFNAVEMMSMGAAADSSSLKDYQRQLAATQMATLSQQAKHREMYLLPEAQLRNNGSLTDRELAKLIKHQEKATKQLEACPEDIRWRVLEAQTAKLGALKKKDLNKIKQQYKDDTRHAVVVLSLTLLSVPAFFLFYAGLEKSMDFLGYLKRRSQAKRPKEKKAPLFSKTYQL